MRQWGRSLFQTYFTIDPRSLGLFRLLFGTVLLSDLARRWAELGLWYTNSGLLPNHTVLWRPPARSMFSLFFTVSNTFEAQLGFMLCAIVYLLFIVGYQTRWAQALALVARVSLNSRLAPLENGGDMVMDLLVLLTVPLPLGLRFSLDAQLAQPAKAVPSDEPEKEPETSGSSEDSAEAPERVAASAALEPSHAPVASLAVLALLLQFSAVYLFNASSKTGQAWQDGSAVYYALHQDKLVTWIGVWMREHLSISTLRMLTWSTLATEWLGFSLIITPFCVKEARLLAICIMPALHLGFALGLNVGGFSPAMMSFYPLLLRPEHWQWLSRRFGARLQPTREKWRSAALLWFGPRPAPAAPAPVNRWALEGATLIVLLSIATEALNDNTPVPPALRVPQPSWAKAVIEYPRILQGWRMFASEPSRIDSMIYVDAVTAEGKHVDPYNQVASDQPEPAGTVVPKHMGQSQFFVMYSERIPYDAYAVYRQAFSEWLIAYPERTRHPGDCLMGYDVYLVTDKTPEPGSGNQPAPLDRQRFMSYSAPLDSPCRVEYNKRVASATNVSGRE
ncbi:MAG TPA: hypothetical protein VHM25_10705 [Polyangiaceae bacterium]|jgi:hypothetical protein|nr:hypothetical protein [Polyangiaceae bacterium]